MDRVFKLPVGVIISPRKEKALRFAMDNASNIVPFGELERELKLTPNQRQRVFASLRRDNLLSYRIIEDEGYLFKPVVSENETCPKYLGCPFFSKTCTDSDQCELPLFEDSLGVADGQ